MKKCLCHGSMLPQRRKTCFTSSSNQSQTQAACRNSLCTRPGGALPLFYLLQPFHSFHCRILSKFKGSWASLSLLDTCSITVTSAEFLSQTHAARSQSKPVRSKGLQFATQSTSLLLSKVQQLKWLCLGKLPPMFLWFYEFQLWGAYWQQLATSNTVEMKATKKSCFQHWTHAHSLYLVLVCSISCELQQKTKLLGTQSLQVQVTQNRDELCRSLGPFLWGHSNLSGSAACLKVRDELTWTDSWSKAFHFCIIFYTLAACWESSDIERLGPAVPSVRIQIKHAKAAKAILFGLGPWCVLQVFRAMLCRDLGDRKISRARSGPVEVVTCPRIQGIICFDTKDSSSFEVLN